MIFAFKPKKTEDFGPSTFGVLVCGIRKTVFGVFTFGILLFSTLDFGFLGFGFMTFGIFDFGVLDSVFWAVTG